MFSETFEQNQGNNGLIFVYGNTGTGKTYSMGLLDLIEEHSNGLVPDALRYVFSILSIDAFIQKGKATKTTVFLYLSVKYIWMKCLTYWP